MTCEIISTGGKAGNAVLVNGQYLFDCGVPFGRLKPYLKRIKLVFLTHIHGDHFKEHTIYRLAKSHPMIRFVCSINLLPELVCRAHIPLERIVLVTPEQSPKTIPGAFPGEWVTVYTFPLIHDVENVAYVIKIEGGEQDGTAMYATDTHHIPFNAPDLDLYMIEANYSREEIDARKAAKAAAGDFSYESRVEASHMSLETAVEWLRDNCDHYKSRIVFLHGHTERGGTDHDTLDTGVLESDSPPENDEPCGRAGADEQGHGCECGCSGNAGEPVALGCAECNQWRSEQLL